MCVVKAIKFFMNLGRQLIKVNIHFRIHNSFIPWKFFMIPSHEVILVQGNDFS